MLSAALASLALIASSNDETSRPILALHLASGTGVDSRTLQHAKHEVSLVFGAAAVDIAWIDKESTQSFVVRPEIEIVLLSEERSREPLAKYGLRYDHLGYVLRPELRVYVFWWHVREAAFHFSRDVGEVLGLVIAHELGHLLLPHGDHSSSGIMQTAFDLSVRWPQRFTGEEAALIHAALVAHQPDND